MLKIIDIEGVLAKWCWDNGYVSSDEHEILDSLYGKYQMKKFEMLLGF